jgi:peptidoglycan/LPS O-acetylase OafA/YrhL
MLTTDHISETAQRPAAASAVAAPEADPAGSSPKAAPVRLAVLDGMRLLAAGAVASYHYLGPTTPTYWGESPKVFAYPLHHAAMYGWLGVEAFFLISGFVICMSAWGRSPGQFAASRISRLFPAYWFAILLIVAQSVLIAVQTKNAARVIDPRTILANLTMLPGPLNVTLLDGVSWTLAVEAVFYVLMAVVLAFGATYGRMLRFCSLWLVVAFITQQTQSSFLNAIDLSDYTGLFVTGITLYLMYRFGQNLLLWVLMGLAWCYQLTVLQLRIVGHPADSGTTRTVSYSLCALLLTGFLVLLILATIGPLARVRWGWLATAGALTYPFYLVHQSVGVPMGEALTRHVPGLGHWGIMGLTLVTMLGLSWLIHRWVERPLGRLMRRQLTRSLNPAEVVRT